MWKTLMLKLDSASKGISYFLLQRECSNFREDKVYHPVKKWRNMGILSWFVQWAREIQLEVEGYGKYWKLEKQTENFINFKIIWHVYTHTHTHTNIYIHTHTYIYIHQIRSDQSLSRVRLFATPWIAARQASLSITNSRSSFRLTSIESVMPSSHLILCRPLLLLPPIPPSIRVFTLCTR